MRVCGFSSVFMLIYIPHRSQADIFSPVLQAWHILSTHILNLCIHLDDSLILGKADTNFSDRNNYNYWSYWIILGCSHPLSTVKFPQKLNVVVAIKQSTSAYRTSRFYFSLIHLWLSTTFSVSFVIQGSLSGAVSFYFQLWIGTTKNKSINKSINQCAGEPRWYSVCIL